MSNRVGVLIVLLLVLVPSGCEKKQSYSYGNKPIDPDTLKFNDSAVTNAEIAGNLDALTFVDTAGQQVRISDYAGKKNLLVVITRGFTSPICPFCNTQTSRLVANYDKFQSLDTEVLLVYPGNAGQLANFLRTVRTVDKGQLENVPFRIVLDDGLDAVQFFGIHGNRARPSTYIFDKQGRTRFAYVGKGDGDRPSIAAIVKQLELLQE